MNNLLLLVPVSVCDSLTNIPGVTVMSLPSQSSRQMGWPSVSDMRKLAETHSHIATTACSDAAIIREMLGLLCDESPDVSTAIVFSDEPVPFELRESLPECLHPFLRRPQPRDLVVASAEALASTTEGSLMDVLVNPGMTSMALSRNPDIDRFPLPGPGSGLPVIDLNKLKSAISSAVSSLEPGTLEHRCLESGLLLFWDFPEESHQISQTMEGKGSPRTGDYWHGIMHRREPDAGNASYWFRRVGRHPAFEHLGTRIVDWMSELGATAPQIDLVCRRLLSNRSFDPFAMIQLSERALVYPDSEEDVTCRMVQYLEMLNLLSWSCGR